MNMYIIEYREIGTMLKDIREFQSFKHAYFLTDIMYILEVVDLKKFFLAVLKYDMIYEEIL